MELTFVSHDMDQAKTSRRGGVKIPWSAEEDEKLLQLVHDYGHSAKWCSRLTLSLLPVSLCMSPCQVEDLSKTGLRKEWEAMQGAISQPPSTRDT